MAVHVVAVGRLRDAPMRAACERYLRRIDASFRVAVREVPDAGRRAATALAATRFEAERLRAALPDGALVVAMTRRGESLSSRAFAQRLGAWRDAARDVAFLVGGPHGLDQSLVDASDVRLALSAFTLPHELARLILLEQLYRAGTILRGHPYHKGG